MGPKIWLNKFMKYFDVDSKNICLKVWKFERKEQEQKRLKKTWI